MPQLAHGAWVFVGDGQKALFLINEGDEKFPNLRRLAVEEHKDPPSREQGSDAPGRPIPASARFAVPLERRTGTNSKRNVSLLQSRTGSIRFALSGAFNQLVTVAPPKILGDLRRKFTKETETKIIARGAQGSHSSYDPGDRTFVDGDADGGRGENIAGTANRLDQQPHHLGRHPFPALDEIDQLIPVQRRQGDEPQPLVPGGAAIGVPTSF